MANSERVPLETIRKRSERAVDYYKKCVVPAYQGRSSPMKSQGYDSMENINGIYTSHNGNTDQNRGTKGGVTFQDSSGTSNSSVKHNDSFTRGGQRATFHGTHSSKWKSAKSRSKEKSKSPESNSSSKRSSQGLSRSNSNLEMDSIDFDDASDFHNSSMRRDYGSTSSLDVLSTSGDTSFFAMVKDLGHRNLDQRSPAPAQMQEFLRGRIDSNRARSDKFSNGSTTPERGGGEEVDGSPRSKSMKVKSGKERKTRSKSITNDSRTGNILNKFRGKQEVEIGTKMTDSINSEIGEERLRRKTFVHYDCQSLGFDIQAVINKRSDSNVSKNTSTGASAASGQVRSSMAGEKDTPDISTDTDEGDGKSNALVLSCPFFRNELGGEEERTISLGRNVMGKSSNQNNNNTVLIGTSAITSTRSPACCGLSILDSLPTPTGLILPHVVLHRGHVIEYVDHGASYYRHFFYGYDHQNYFGIDDNVGPVAISIRKEKVDDRENNLGRADYGFNQFRVIVRTSELTTLRGVILEDAIPTSASRLGGSRTTTVKDVIEYICPDLQTSSLKLASSSQKSLDQLLKVDQQGVNQTYKVGIMYCKAGQSSEEDMYNNEHSGPAFEEFLSCIGQKVRLKGFEKYRAQLDNKTDSTGQQSVYTTFNNCEIMFHVSTMLPYTPNNTQQLLRKRHIGNDIVTIVFQEPGAKPFTPKTVRSQFQHVFIIVRVHNPCTENVRYSIAVTRSKDVPPFGPHIPENATFPRSDQFAEFLLAKVINAENAAHRCEKFIAMATRTRTEYLKDLAQNHVTTTTLDSSKLSKFSLGSGRKKDKVKQKVVPDMYASGAIIWNVQVEDFGSGSQVDSVLAISSEVLVIEEESSKSVIFTVHCGAIIGWTAQANSIKIYFNQEESILVRLLSGEMEETDEICSRLRAVTPGCPSEEKTLKRNGLGQLGFHINADAIVTDVEKNSFAYEVGLLKGSRLVEICKVAVTNLSHEDMVDLLRTSQTVKVTMIPPLGDGTPRGVTTLLTNCRYTSLNTLKAACKATQNVQQRQKEALMGQKSVPLLSPLNSSHHSLCKTSSDSSEYLYQRHKTELTTSTETLSMEFLKTEFASIFSGSNENLFSPEDQPSQLSSSSSEQSFHLRDSLNSNSSLKLDIRLSSSSSEFATSPTQKDPPRAESPSHRGFQTLPHNRKPSTPTRGDRHSPVKSLVPGYRPLATSSLQRGAGLHHAFTDSVLSSKTSSPYDEGYTSRQTDTLRSDDGKHERSGSRDSGDYQYLSGAPRPWSSTRATYNQIRRQDPTNSSGDSGSYGSPLHMSESVPASMSLIQSSNFSRKYSGPGGDYSAVQHGNISLELMKQTQNSKYLLSQGQESGVRSTNSSVNLSDTSFSSGSSHNSGAVQGQRGYSDPSYHSNSSRDDLTSVGKKRADPTSANSKGRPVGHRRTHLSEVSPLSSENGSPRSSQKNLSGMSSEESLNTRLRPGVNGKHSKTQSNELQEDLKRLIDMDLKNSDLRGILQGSSIERPSFPLKRTMSDESLHSQKGATISPSRDAIVADLIFSTAPPVPALPKEVLADARLSPRAMFDNAMAAKARQVLSRNAAAAQPRTQQNPVPLPESAASLDWSNLVSVATKAIDSTDGSKSQSSAIKDPKDRALPPEPGKSVTNKPTSGYTKPPTSQPQGGSVWRSAVSNPQQRIQELEMKVEQLEMDLDKERKENADLEEEVQSLRRDNIRLQEESQTAAAQLRKFTEWFFQTIDRQ